LTGVQIHIPPFLLSYTENLTQDYVSGNTIMECLMLLVAYTENLTQDYVSGNTIMECLMLLVERFPQLKSRLFDTKDKLRRDLKIYLNKSHVHPREFSRPVKNGDELYIVGVIVGG